MSWDAKGNALCDSCAEVRGVNGDVQVLRALGWHHSKGKTLRGADYEGILCPHCARNERKRSINKRTETPGQLDIFGGTSGTDGTELLRSGHPASGPNRPAVSSRGRGRKFHGD